MPDKVRFATKPQIALEQIRTAQADGIPPGVVLADAGYGADTGFRDGITALGLAYVVGIQSSASLWPPGQAPLPVKPWSGRGRPPTRVGRSAEHKPVSARDLAAGLPRNAWRRMTWRQGADAPLASRFAAVRIRPAHRDYKAATPRAEEWCLSVPFSRRCVAKLCPRCAPSRACRDRPRQAERQAECSTWTSIGCSSSRPETASPRAGPAASRCAGSEQLRRQHDVAVLAALAVLDPDQHAAAVDIGDLEANHLGHPQPGGVGGRQRGAGLQARHRLEKAHDLISAQHHRQLARLAGVGDPLRDLGLPSVTP